MHLENPSKERGATTRIVELFITSKLSLLLLIASFIAGFAALALTPREEEPKLSFLWQTCLFLFQAPPLTKWKS